jgi:hypothetical protein
MVVHVLALLDFAGNHAIVVSAREHPSKGDFVLAVLGPVVPLQYILEHWQGKCVEAASASRSSG